MEKCLNCADIHMWTYSMFYKLSSLKTRKDLYPPNSIGSCVCMERHVLPFGVTNSSPESDTISQTLGFIEVYL